MQLTLAHVVIRNPFLGNPWPCAIALFAKDFIELNALRDPSQKLNKFSGFGADFEYKVVNVQHTS